MSDKAPRTTPVSKQPFTVSAQVRSKLNRKQTRYWRQMQQNHLLERRYWVQMLRARQRSPIRGFLVAHRRMFGVSHKSVQPGQVQADSDA
jgi:hypothetical protein